MPVKDELLRFIEAAKASGAPDDSVAGLLKSGGWSERDVYASLRAHYEQSTGLAVPIRRGIGEGARDAFIYLLASGTLATWIIALGSLCFAAIDRQWPDPVQYGRSYFFATDLASLLVAFPVFMLVSRVAVRDVREDASKREAPVRRWLTYLSMLIAASVVIGDVITFLAYLLQGEITMRFVSKVLVVFVLATGVFWYYFASLRTDQRDSRFAYAAYAAAAAGLVIGFWLLGSPAQQRDIGADRRRIEHLRGIAAELHARGGTPPSSLQELNSPRMDPVTGNAYDYRPLEGTRYELCAVFGAASPQDSRQLSMWRHEAGRHCFVLDASRQAP
jgi:hypothetical protein